MAGLYVKVATEKQIIMDLKNQTQKRTIKFRIFNKKIKSYIDIHSSAIMIDELNDLNEHLIVEQFTGLHDKNGKKIYEGDVLEDTLGRKKLVEYYKDGFWLNASLEGAEWCLRQVNSSSKVIGSIYENPKLLEK